MTQQARVVVAGTLDFARPDLERIVLHLRAMIEASRLQAGCIAYDAAEDLFSPGTVRITEMWEDAASLKAHEASAPVAAWFEALKSSGIKHSRYFVCDVAGLRVV